MTAYRHWRINQDADGLLWVTLDKEGASTNSLSTEVLEEFNHILDEVARRSPKAMVLRSGKPSGFIAGADVHEFLAIRHPEDAKRMIRRGWDPFEKLERLPFPTVAWIDGFCMGGGLELALACRYRVAVDEPRTRIALPEVMLGIWPMMGGVKRLPRVVAPPQALDMMLTGRAVDARRARRMGLVDAAVPARVAENAARLTALRPPPRRKLPLFPSLLNMPALRRWVANAARRQVRKRVRPEHYPAPFAILDAWEKYDGDPFRIPDRDPASVASLIQGDTARNLIRLFLLQERLKSLGKQLEFEARRVHVVGAGVMGGDIAAVCALRGLRVTLQDQSAKRLEPAMKRAAQLFERRLHDRLRVRDALDRLTPDINGDGVRHADVVIEAIFENLEAKRALFRDIEAKVRPDAILATNTSSLRLSHIAAALKTPSRLVGVHFFNPVPNMQLVEVVSTPDTDTEVAARAAAFVRAIDKLPLPVKDSPGFLVNRVLGPYLQQALRLLDEGEAPESLDASMEAFGMPMGPVELADVVGLDICLAVGKELTGASEPPRKLQQLVQEGKLGKKSGRGFYAWIGGKPQKGPRVQARRDLEAKLLAPYLAEAQKALAEGIVPDADLVDAGLVFGTGFAPFRGGPLNYLKSRANQQP